MHVYHSLTPDRRAACPGAHARNTRTRTYTQVLLGTSEPQQMPEGLFRTLKDGDECVLYRMCSLCRMCYFRAMKDGASVHSVFLSLPFQQNCCITGDARAFSRSFPPSLLPSPSSLSPLARHAPSSLTNSHSQLQESCSSDLSKWGETNRWRLHDAAMANQRQLACPLRKRTHSI